MQADRNYVMRCADCRGVRPYLAVCEDGMCLECAGIRWKIAYKLSDAECAKLESEGYVFDDEHFTDDPNYRAGE